MHKISDGKTKKAQKHKNRSAFKIVFDTKSLQHQKKVSLENLCLRCTQQMQWKLTYNKYNRMSEPARCNICSQKHVFRSYMKVCQKCAAEKDICAKCLATDYERPANVKLPQKVQKLKGILENQKQIEFMKSLKQRSRRTIRRNLQKGLIHWSEKQEYFVDNETGQNMIGLHFRKGISGLSDDEDEDEDIFGDEDEGEKAENGQTGNLQNDQCEDDDDIDL